MKKTIIAIGVVWIATVQTLWGQQLVKLNPILEVEDTIQNAQLGAYVKGVGDLNKDGYADVAVSAPGLFKTYIYYGGKTMSQTPSLTLKGGGHIASGDFRGNGWIDLAIEIPFHDSVLVYYNGPNGLDTIPDLILTMPSDYFGSVMTTGDFFGNGHTDLAMGTMDAGNSLDTSLYLRGRIFIYASGVSMETIPVDTLMGDTIRAGLGIDLAAGDIYGNGKDEIVALGFNQLRTNYNEHYDYVSVFSSDSSSQMKKDYYIDSRHVKGGFGGPLGDGGGSVACFDADGDGTKDILVSGICIFKGGNKIDTLPTYRVGPPRSDTADYGAYPWVGGGGDYNGDGIPDILLTSERGVFGATSGAFVMVDGRGHPGQFMGYRVYATLGDGLINLSGTPQNAGDVNGGGVDDIIIGNGGYPYPAYNGFFGIYSGDTSMVAAIKKPQAPVRDFKLNQNYPNPFNPTTAISYELSEVSRVTLKIYDALGREVVTIKDDESEMPGTHTIYWDGTNERGERVSSGTYFYQLTTNHGTETKKALYLK